MEKRDLTILRKYDPEKDRESVGRIWYECGWVEKDKQSRVWPYAEGGPAHVAEIAGSAECAVMTMPGTLLHRQSEISVSCVTGVTTSRIARKQGLAARLMAISMAEAADCGTLVSALGMFEQGFYNRLGYGTGPYLQQFGFDPSHLTLNRKIGAPVRLDKTHAEEIHRNRLNRMASHGGICILPQTITEFEIESSKNGFGLGFRNSDGELTHHLWMSADDVENGPYQVNWMVYQDRLQWLDLMALLRSMGDQIRQVKMSEPPEFQIQDLLSKPLRTMAVSKGSAMEHRCNAYAYWQIRMLDVAGCLEKTHLPGIDLSFTLKLSDPIEAHLPEDANWRGTGGEYSVHLGPDSSASNGSTASLPTLEATVGAFTRMWLGVRPASGLAATDHLSGPEELLDALDDAFRLPTPWFGWDF